MTPLILAMVGMLGSLKNFGHIGHLYEYELGAGIITPPPGTYVAEDGVSIYVTEDGLSDYVTEA